MSRAPRSGSPGDASAAPGLVRALSVLVAAQGVGLLAITGFYLVEVASASATDPSAALVTAGMALGCGLGLLLVARGLRRARRWARAPALLTQLLVIPVAIGLVQSERWYVGVPLLGWAGAGVVLLFSPAAGAQLDR